MKKFFSRDYFGRTNSSLSCFSAPQGLFRPARFISILLFFSAGIISTGRIHPYLALFLRRDYFGQPDSSLSCSFLHRDYFGRPDSSLSCSFSSQGLFRPAGFISILLFFSAGIISAGRMLLIAEDTSTRPFHQLPICLIINEVMICSFLIILRIKAFLYKKAPIHSQNYVQEPSCQNHV